MVLVAGLEPARYLYRGILSPLRLPIPPHERIVLRKKLCTGYVQSFLEAPPGFEPGDKGFADLGLTTWLWRLIVVFSHKKPLIKKMERETRFELATFALARRRSTTEPFPHKQ